MSGDMPTMEREPKLFGQPKYDVQRLADSIQEVGEAEKVKPELYEAAMKLISKRQVALTAILKSKKQR